MSTNFLQAIYCLHTGVRRLQCHRNSLGQQICQYCWYLCTSLQPPPPPEFVIGFHCTKCKTAFTVGIHILVKTYPCIHTCTYAQCHVQKCTHCIPVILLKKGSSVGNGQLDICANELHQICISDLQWHGAYYISILYKCTCTCTCKYIYCTLKMYTCRTTAYV